MEAGQRLRAETQVDIRKDARNQRLGGQGRPAIRRARTKGPGIPSPSFPQPPSGEGLASKDLPLSPRPRPFPPTLAPWAPIQLQFPVTFRRPGTGEENFFQYSQIPPPWRLHVFHSFPRTPESMLQSPSSLGPWSPGRDRQRPQAEPNGAVAFRTPVGQNPSPALPHVARQRDGGAG